MTGRRTPPSSRRGGPGLCVRRGPSARPRPSPGSCGCRPSGPRSPAAVGRLAHLGVVLAGGPRAHRRDQHAVEREVEVRQVAPRSGPGAARPAGRAARRRGRSAGAVPYRTRATSDAEAASSTHGLIPLNSRPSTGATLVRASSKNGARFATSPRARASRPGRRRAPSASRGARRRSRPRGRRASLGGVLVAVEQRVHHRDQLQGARVVVGVQATQDRDGDVGVPRRAVVVTGRHGELGELRVQCPFEVRRQRRVGEPLARVRRGLGDVAGVLADQAGPQQTHLRGDRVGPRAMAATRSSTG